MRITIRHKLFYLGVDVQRYSSVVDVQQVKMELLELFDQTEATSHCVEAMRDVVVKRSHEKPYYSQLGESLYCTVSVTD